MGFQQGLSGLNAAAKNLEVIGNNVANANVVGFKSAQAQFGDVFASAGGADTQVGIGTQVKAIAQNFAQGSITVTNNPLDIAVNGAGFFRMSNAGAITYTRNGQFHTDNAGYIVNSDNLRLTGYAVDAAGSIVATSPVPLQISTADMTPKSTTAFTSGLNLDARAVTPTTQIRGAVTGTAGAIVFPLTITATVNDTLTVNLNGTAGTATIAPGVYATDASLATAVQTAINAVAGFVSAGYSAAVSASANVLTITSATYGNGSSVNITGGTAQASLKLGTFSTVAGADNFSITNPQSFTSSASGAIYDSLGNSHIFTMYFVKGGAPNTFRTYASVDGAATGGGVPIGVTLAGGASQALTFNNAGALTSPATTVAMSVDLNAVGAALGTVNSATSPLAFTLDLASITQFGTGFSVNSQTQDGYPSGRLSAFTVAGNGVMQGNYSNGQTKTLGQVVLVSFSDPQGLKPQGQNQWSESSKSGSPIASVPGTGNVGVLQSAALEDSNVDLSAELVAMITAQRVYQANAQSIKTQDQVSQTLLNLK